MKKPLAVFLAILFALAMTVPALADDPTPSPTPAPAAKMHVVVTLDDLGAPAMYVQSGTLTCQTMEGALYVLSAKGSVTFDSNDFTCSGTVTWHVYYGYGGSHYSQGGAWAAITDTDPFYYDAEAEANLHEYSRSIGTFTNGSGAAPLDGELYSIRHGSYGTTNSTTPVTTYLYVHDSTRPPCDTHWDDVSTVASGTIAATNEAGLAASLVVASEYRLTVWDGPWNDGSSDRYDTALKIGSDDWTPTSDFATNPDGPLDCSEGDPLDPGKLTLYFHATDVDWKIRVNDIAGEFADNTGSMEFQLDLVQPFAPSGCDSLYLRGALVASGSISATSSAGVHPGYSTKESPYYAGNWIEIVTSGGPWRDAGSPPDLFTVAIKNADGTWSELSAAPGTGCSVPNGDYIDAWYQLPNSDGVYLRVDDEGGVWGNNSGSMSYTIYATTYSPVPPAGCAELYQLGDQITTVSVPASSEIGVKLGDLYSPKEVTTQSYFAIETSGIWYDNSTPEVWAGLAASTSVASDWSDIWNYPTVACAVQLDPIGHWRVYLPVNKDANKYWVRAQEYLDSSWDNNSGSFTVTVYKATYYRVPGYEPGPMPGAGACEPYFTKGAADAAVTILATNDLGDALPVLTSAKIYAVETSAGPWHEGDDDVDSYEVAISTDDGATWENLVAFSSSVCAQSADGQHILVYFQALAGRHYKIRVYDPYDSFAGNSGSIDYKLYEHVVPVGTGNCSDDYNLHLITVTDPKIPANNPGGVNVKLSKEPAPTDIWAIEIRDVDYWYYTATPDEHHEDAQISSDNGSNWSVFGPGLAMGICIVQSKEAPDSGEPYEQLYRIYFQTPGGALKLRLNQDFDKENPTAAGQLWYSLYGAVPKEQPCNDKECPQPPVPVPPGWQAECYENYLRPNYLFKNVGLQLPSIDFGALGSISFPAIPFPVPAVDDWIAYLQWTVRSYFAWCPEHTAVLEGLPLTLTQYEPFGTFAEVTAAVDHINDLLDGLVPKEGGENMTTYAPYSVIFQSGGGETASNSFQGLLPVLDKESPWAWTSGKLTTDIGTDVHYDLVTGSGGETDDGYIDYCTNIFDAHMGQTVSAAMCSLVNLARGAPLLWIVIQMASDVGLIFAFVQYLKKHWIDPRMGA
jgi:hypothetical protein